MPHLQPNDYHLRTEGPVPFIPISVDIVMGNVNKGIELTTKGDF